MALSSAKLFVLFQFSLLFVTCFSTDAKPPGTHPIIKPPPYVPKPPVTSPPTKPPTQPPVKPPSPPPTKPPTQPPVKPPSPPPSKPPAKPPTTPPTKPPTHPPAKPPTTPPTKPPTHPPAKPPVGKPRPCYVQGMIYCKSCGFWGINTLLRAKPLPGARVACKCRKGTRFAKTIAVADKNGFFFMEVTKLVTTFGVQNCRAYLASAPRTSKCRQHSNLNGGISGAILKLNMARKTGQSFDLFTAGPFGFDPAKKFCQRHPHLVLE